MFKGTPVTRKTHKDQTSRREFLRRAALGAVAASPLAGVLLSAAGAEAQDKPGSEPSTKPGKKPSQALTCTDETGLTDAEKAVRASLKYVDKADDPAKACKLCQLYKAAADDKSCGGCVIMKGPIHPDGSCASWVKKAT